MDKIDPSAKRLFLVTTVLLIVIPLSVFFTSRHFFRESRHEILISGFSAVIAVNVVVFAAIRYVYKTEFNEEKQEKKD